MKKISYLSLLLKWLSLKRNEIILFVICCASVTATIFLAGISVTPVLYSLLICTYFAIVFATVDFFRFAAAFKAINAALGAVETLSGNIASYGGAVSAEYEAVIEQLSLRLKSTASEMLSRETEAKDYYTLWTHQIKTPIAAMKLILENDEPDTSLLKSELFRIERYSEMALNFIRLESISDDMKLQKNDIRSIASAALKKYFPLFSMKKLSLEFDDFSLSAVTDEKWLCFVIEQLISNSIKYTRSGGITISLSGRKLIIADTGIGISAQDIPRLGEKGFTGYNGRMDKKSTGLGLYLCRKITQKLGHKLEISSEYGKGTVVTLDFTQDEVEGDKTVRLIPKL